MVPIPQEPTRIKPIVNASDRIVISGVAGLYPQSRNVKEFSEILYNKTNPVNKQKDRWNYDHPEVAQYLGTLPDLTKFDAQFFKVTYRQGNLMDAMSRKILEQTYQAIYDAGVNPNLISGKKIGVYVGICFSETEKSCFYDCSIQTGLGLSGSSKAMFANRVSYWLNAKGPSMAIDEGCCSSTSALELAYLAMTRGDCEMAVVAGSNLCLHPQTSILYGRVLSTCPDGKTKSFDTNADGCAKSEAINVIFLQKAKDALRVYAELVNVKCEFTDLCFDETGPIYGFYRSPEKMANFIKGFYDEVNVSPKAVEYVEAVGSAIPEADKAELEAISDIFCKDRIDPLLVGSVMSNIGYTEAASGLSALTKVILAYETGKIAANLHCDSPRQDVPALREGKIRLVTDHTDFGRSYAAINGLSITGVNSHVLLNGCYKPKVPSRYKSNIPYLVTLSGRQESAVAKIIHDLKSRSIDPEELALLHNIHEAKISGHLGRGYVILDTDESNTTISLSEKMEYYDDTKRPLWFVYSGMGSQWSGMGKQLLRIPAFAAAIEKCKRVLEPQGIDIIDVICSDDKTIFDNVQNSFVGIAAMQIGLTDVLKELDIKPDKIIGHSVGELGCAYADGCFTVEEMILAASYRGQVSLETPLIYGAMAAVGLGYQQIIKLCPPEIEVACHNSPESCTISGPAEMIHEFVKVLVSKGVFAREVPCSNIAYHSRYIAGAGPKLLEILKKVIKSPKPRSERWISSSVPMNRWDEPLAKYSSAEYHTNNLLSPVLFEETSRLIPSNAVLIEIAPHGLLQAILKRSFPSCHHVPLTRRGYPNAVQFFLQAVGELYMDGFNPKIRALYPKIEFPVSTGTRPLSHLVEWVHQEEWALPILTSAPKQKASACKYVISTHDDDYSYLRGNIIRGKNLFPFAAALVLVWDTFAMTLMVERKKLSVQFRDVHFHSQPLLHDQRQLRINITIQRGTGRFEVMEEDIKVISGYITADINSNKILEVNSKFLDSTQLYSKDIYQLLHTRGYNYTDDFRSIYRYNFSLTEAQIIWQNNWITFIDAMLQLSMLNCNHNMICMPESLSKLTIDVENHFNYISNAEEQNILIANIFKTQDCIKCGGVIIDHIIYGNLPPLNKDVVSLKTKKFIPHFPTSNSDELTASYIYLQIAAENLNKQFINVVEILRDETAESNFEAIRGISNNIPGIRTEHSYVYRDKILEDGEKINSADLLLTTNLSSDKNMNQMLQRVLKCDSLLVNKELYKEGKSNRYPSMLYRSINAHIINDSRIELAIWKPKDSNGSSVYTVRSPSDLTYVSSLIPTIPLSQEIYLLASYPLIKGLKSLLKEWRNERKVYLTIIEQDEWDDKFLNEILFKDTVTNVCENNIEQDEWDDKFLNEILFQDIVTNVCENGIWGGEYILPLEEKSTPKHNMMLKCTLGGDVNSIYWIEAPQKYDNGISVDVHYAGINLVYVKEEAGITHSYHTDGQRALKVDFSGITKAGNRVMGIAPDQVISTQVTAQPELLWPVPDHWSLEDAATVPLAYCIAFYCLIIKTQLIPGRRVFIHGGAGALGQALISIALAFHCEVFVTVSDIRKKQFLQKLFPQLQDDHIGNSCDHSFGDMVLNATRGEGCDVIVSCVQGELKNTTLKCCATSGITLDTTQLLSREDFKFGMYNLTKCRSYATINFSKIFENPEQLLKLQALVCEGIARGYVRPLSRVTFMPQEAPRAFRLLVARRHRGRVLLDLRHHALIASIPRLRCASDMCQVILSKDEELGIQLAERLANRGAQNINLYCEKISNILLFKQRYWEEDGVNIKVSQGNINQANLVDLIEGNINRAIEGLYLYDVISQNEEIDKSEEIILKVKKLLPKLKHFAIINSNFNIDEQINVGRSREPIPVWVKLPTLDKLDITKKNYSSEELISPITAVDVVEKALCSKQSVVIASKVTLPHVPLMQAISKMAGINIEDKNSETNTLKDLGIDFSIFEAIRAYLNYEHNISLTNQDISSLTLKTLKNLEQNTMKINYTEDDGLKSFFFNVDSDEIQASTDIVLLPTLTNTMSDGEFDKSQAYMCVVPGVEGHYERFRVMCERLKLPALVLQPGLNYSRESMNDLANRYVQVLLKKTGLHDKFFLLGYESGVLIAIKMAEILEAHGMLGTIFCIGGSPDDIKAHFQDKLSIYKTEVALQNAILQHITSLMMKNTDERINKNLETAVTWDEKVLACTRIMKETIQHSSQYAKQIIEFAYAKLSQVLQYEPVPVMLRSNIVCLRPTTCTATTLQKYSEQPVVEYNLNIPLAYITQDLRCSAIINRHIGDDILKRFNKTNLCEILHTSESCKLSILAVA